MRLTLKDELAFARVTVSYRGAQADIDDVLVVMPVIGSNVPHKDRCERWIRSLPRVFKMC